MQAEKTTKSKKIFFIICNLGSQCASVAINCVLVIKKCFVYLQHDDTHINNSSNHGCIVPSTQRTCSEAPTS